MRETTVEYLAGTDTLTWYSSEQRWVNKIRKLAAEYPNDVKIVADNDDGSVIAHLPRSWFRAPAPKKTRVMTEEQRQAAVERLEKIRNNKNPDS